jgi:hypothetical protein
MTDSRKEHLFDERFYEPIVTVENSLRGALVFLGVDHGTLAEQRERFFNVGLTLTARQQREAIAAGLMCDADRWGPYDRAKAIRAGANPSYEAEPPASGFRIAEDPRRAA